MSAGTLVFIGAVVASATGAFFSDVETSSANTFTAGSIDLQVDSQAHYAGLVCDATNHWVDDPNVQEVTTRPDLLNGDCDGTWVQGDLGPTNQFFNLSDIKPGDEGENTISLHVINNDAWMCADVDITANDDESSVEPELAAGDVAEDSNNDFDGELAQNIQFVAWADLANTNGAVAGDNIWQASEPLLFDSGPASNILGVTTTLALADSTTGNGPFEGDQTTYVGLAWCAGDIDTSIPGTLTCDGGSMGNQAQTDSMTANISFRAEQSRNNPNFTCSAGNNVVVVNQNDLGVGPNPWFFYNDTNDTVMTPDQFSGQGGENHMEVVASEAGAKMKLDTNPNPRYNIATAQFSNLLNTISSLKFRVYDATADGDTPFIQFNVDFPLPGPAYEGRLTMQPGSGGNSALPPATWTTVDAQGTAMWTWSKFAVGPDLTAATADDNSWPDADTNQYRSWNSIVAAFPTAKLLSPGSFLGVRTGQPGPAGATNYVSSIEFDGTTYNFEL